MYKHCNTEESALRQKQIEHCLLEIMQTMPYTQITISDICALAEISRKSFYRYFGSKDDCLHALIDHCILEASGAYLTDNSPLETQALIFEHFFKYWKAMKPLLDALFQNDMANILFERSMICVTQEELDFRNHFNTDLYDDSYEQVLFIVSGITGLILNWHLSGYKKTATQLSATVDRLLGNGRISDHKHEKKS